MTTQFNTYKANIGFRIVKKTFDDIASKDFFVEGWATTTDVDFEDDYFARSAMDAMAKGLLMSPTVFFNHDYGREVGVVKETSVQQTEGGWGVWIKVFISEVEVEIRTKIAEGVLSGFSVGGRLLETVTVFSEEVGRKVRKIIDFLIYEVSVVGIPCNRMARAIEWYTKMYRDLAEDTGKILSLDKLADLTSIAKKTDNFLSKGMRPTPPATLFEESDTREKAEMMSSMKAAVPSHTSPEANRGRSWDGDGAVMRLRRYYSSDGSGDKGKMNWDSYRKGFAQYNPDSEKKYSSYKLPHHDVVNGEPKVVFRGVAAAIGAMQGSRGGVEMPEADRSGVRRHLTRHHQQFEPGVDPFDKSVVRNVKMFLSDPPTLHTLKDALSEGEWQDVGIPISKSIQLFDLELFEFVNNLWDAAIEESRSTGVFGPIDDDGFWYPLMLEAVFDSDVVFFNTTDETMYKAAFSTPDGLSFAFGEGIEVTPRTVYDEVKSVGKGMTKFHPPLIRRAMPEHQTPISDEDESWNEDKALEGARKWASSDSSGDDDTIDLEKLGQAFAWANVDEGVSEGTLLLMHHEVRENELYLNQKALNKTVKTFKGSRDDLGIPEEDIPGVERHLIAHLRQIDPDAANPFQEDEMTIEDGNVEVENEDKVTEPEANKDAEEPVADESQDADTESVEDEVEDEVIEDEVVEDDAAAEESDEVEDVVEGAVADEPDDAPEEVVEDVVEEEPAEAVVEDEEPDEVEDVVEDDSDKSMDSLMEGVAIKTIAKIFGVSADADELRRALSVVMRGVAVDVDTVFDSEDAEQNIRRFCSSDDTGNKSTMDWKTYKGFFAKFEGDKSSFKSYSAPMYDIVDNQPVVIRAAVEQVLMSHKGASLELSEPDKRRVQTAYKMFGTGNPFAMSVEDVARKEVTDRVGEVKSLCDDLNKRLDEISARIDSLEKAVDSTADPEEVKNLTEAVDEIANRLGPVEKAAGMSQQIPAAETETEKPSKKNKGFAGTMSGLNKMRASVAARRVQAQKEQ